MSEGHLSVRSYYGSGQYTRMLCCVALFTKFVSIILCIAGLVQMKQAFESSDMSEYAATFMPWATAGVVVLALVLAVPDVVVAESILSQRAPRWCGRGFTAFLHPALWVIVLLFGVAMLSLAVGHAIRGLADSAGSLGDNVVLFGLTGNEISSLGAYMDEYVTGATIFAVGSFLAAPAQGWILSASLQNMDAIRASETPYTPRRRLDELELEQTYKHKSRSGSRGSSRNSERSPLISTNPQQHNVMSPNDMDTSHAAASRRRLELAGLSPS